MKWAVSNENVDLPLGIRAHPISVRKFVLQERPTRPRVLWGETTTESSRSQVPCRQLPDSDD